MFGSKPQAANPSGANSFDTRCRGPWQFKQYLVMLQPHASSQSQASAAAKPWEQGVVELTYWGGVAHHISTQHKRATRQEKHTARHAVEDSVSHYAGPAMVKEKNWNPFIYKDQLFFSYVSAMIACFGVHDTYDDLAKRWQPCRCLLC